MRLIQVRYGKVYIPNNRGGCTKHTCTDQRSDGRTEKYSTVCFAGILVCIFRQKNKAELNTFL